MKNIFTYVVDHGDKPPSVTLKDKINGGVLIHVTIEDEVEKLEAVRKFLTSLADHTEDPATQFQIEDFLKSI